MASNVVFSDEQLNYFRVSHIVNDILPPALRSLFHQEWNNRYKTTLGEWKDTPQNGRAFKNIESADNQEMNKKHLRTMVNGDTAQWDCTKLFYAILYSDSIGPGLSQRIKTNVHKLRRFRNDDWGHMTKGGQLSDADFKTTVAKVKRAFRALGLSTVGIQAASKLTTFPTNELQIVKTSNQKLTRDLKKKKAELQENKDRLKTIEEQSKVFEEQLQREVEPFCVLPPKPPHVIASRDFYVDNVTQKLLNLRKANENTLSSCYISGNPGSGKSQLAGLAAEKLSLIHI